MADSKDMSQLVKAILLLNTEEEILSLFKDLLTRSEQRILVLRWKVAKMLDQGLPYTEIEKLTGASSATIAKVSEFLRYGYDGYRVALDRVKMSKQASNHE